MKTNESNLKCHPEHSGKMNPARCVDADLNEKVLHALQVEFPGNWEKITVRVFDRTVYLEGMVNSEQERKGVNEAAVNIFGVRNVVNYLTFPCPYITGNYQKNPQN